MSPEDAAVYGRMHSHDAVLPAEPTGVFWRILRKSVTTGTLYLYAQPYASQAFAARMAERMNRGRSAPARYRWFYAREDELPLFGVNDDNPVNFQNQEDRPPCEPPS